MSRSRRRSGRRAHPCVRSAHRPAGRAPRPGRLLTHRARVARPTPPRGRNRGIDLGVAGAYPPCPAAHRWPATHLEAAFVRRRPAPISPRHSSLRTPNISADSGSNVIFRQAAYMRKAFPPVSVATDFLTVLATMSPSPGATGGPVSGTPWQVIVDRYSKPGRRGGNWLGADVRCCSGSVISIVVPRNAASWGDDHGNRP